jgi:hypothetical protein
MKSLPLAKHFSRAFVLLVFISALSGCNDDSSPSLISRTQFVSSTLTVSENGGEQSIALAFDKPAPSDGEVIVTAVSGTPTCYSTSPILELGQVKVKVSKGDISRTFKMTPTDNSNLDGVRVVKFRISSVSEGLSTGASTEMIVSVTDDEEEAEAGFESTGLRVRENDPAITKIEIVFTHEVAAAGTLVVELGSTVGYGVTYTTQPTAVAGKIFLQVPKGATSAFISFYAINDNAVNADRDVRFTLVDATGGVSIGDNTSFLCTITDDDGAQATAIVTIRSMYSGAARSLESGTYIEGVVTSENNTLAGRVIIQDETGALAVQLLAENMPDRGDRVFINLTGTQLRVLSGTLEVGPVSSYEKIGEDVVFAEKMSLSDLLGLGKRVESKTVQLSGVTFPQANGTATLRGDRILTDGGQTIIVRTGANASFGNDVVPGGAVIVTGIFTYADGIYVLYPQESKDIRKQGISPIKDGLINKPR